MLQLLDEPVKGSLLVAEPFLGDPNFERTVVLLTEHNSEGTVGFVLNKPLDLRLGQAVPELRGVDVPIFYGGPVQRDSLFYVHTEGSLIPDSHRIREGLYWGGNFHALLELYSTGVVNLNAFKFFLGYSGWGANQLKAELSDHSWLVLDHNEIELLLDDTEALWKKILLSLGGGYPLWANAPADPTLN